VQTQNLSFDQVKASLCNDMKSIMPIDCANLSLDVETFPSFVDVTTNSPIQNNNFSNAGFGFNPGTPASIVVVRAYYNWQIITPLMQPLLQNTSNSRVLASTMMFRNEPYTAGP
jgi:Flp pilus assembly protein TadG